MANIQTKFVSLLFAFGAVCIGGIVVVQGGLNRVLSLVVGNVVLVVIVNFITGFVLLGAWNTIVYFSAVRPKGGNLLTEVEGRLSLWELIAGVLGSAATVARVFLTPLIGFTMFNILSVTGQLFTSMVLDHIGFQGLTKRGITKVRVGGIIGMAVGCVVSNVDTLTSTANYAEKAGIVNFLVYCIGALCSGMMLPVQAAGNRKVSSRFNPRMALMAAVMSFTTGLIFLSVATVILQTAGVIEAPNSVEYIAEHIRMYYLLGGFLGTCYVSFVIIFVRRVGVSIFFVCAIAGSIISSCVLDEIGAFMTPRSPTSALRGVGVSITFLGAACVVFSEKIEAGITNLIRGPANFQELKEDNNREDIEMQETKNRIINLD